MPRSDSLVSEKFHKDWAKLRLWYNKGARDLPWRRAPVDPYKIWISEVMSQQSTLVTVIPYFQKWMLAFPNLHDLSKAPQEKVLKLWAGLGYYSRARNVHAAAQALDVFIKEQGHWPQSAEQWLNFKGVGPYTAAAIASIAFKEKIVPIDGNVIRVAARYWGIKDPLNNPKDKLLIENLLKEIPSPIKSSDMPILAQSLMELGATLCKPAARALCDICPLQNNCTALSQNKQHLWPLSKNRASIEEKWILAKLWGLEDNKIYVQQIPQGQRLEGQWQVPQEELGSQQFAKLQKQDGLLGPVSHSITKYRYKVLGQVISGKPNTDTLKKLKLQAFSLKAAPQLTTLTLKLLKKHQ